MTLEYNSKYLSNPHKMIYYNDNVMTFNGSQLQNIASGAAVNSVLTNGLSTVGKQQPDKTEYMNEIDNFAILVGANVCTYYSSAVSGKGLISSRCPHLIC
jgi:hypothetical protein